MTTMKVVYTNHLQDTNCQIIHKKKVYKLNTLLAIRQIGSMAKMIPQ